MSAKLISPTASRQYFRKAYGMLDHMDHRKEEIAKQKPGLPCADCCVSADLDMYE